MASFLTTKVDITTLLQNYKGPFGLDCRNKDTDCKGNPRSCKKGIVSHKTHDMRALMHVKAMISVQRQCQAKWRSATGFLYSIRKKMQLRAAWLLLLWHSILKLGSANCTPLIANSEWRQGGWCTKNSVRRFGRLCASLLQFSLLFVLQSVWLLHGPGTVLPQLPAICFHLLTGTPKDDKKASFTDFFTGWSWLYSRIHSNEPYLQLLFKARRLLEWWGDCWQDRTFQGDPSTSKRRNLVCRLEPCGFFTLWILVLMLFDFVADTWGLRYDKRSKICQELWNPETGHLAGLPRNAFTVLEMEQE